MTNEAHLGTDRVAFDFRTKCRGKHLRHRVSGAKAIHCYVGNGSLSVAADCDELGLQREELYCRNETTAEDYVVRDCVSMSWHASGGAFHQLGCFGAPGNVTKCTCATDLCNAPHSLMSEDVIGRNGVKCFKSSALIVLNVLVLCSI